MKKIIKTLALCLISAMIITSLTGCGVKQVTKDPTPEVKVDRSDFIRGIINATKSGMVNDELKEHIDTFIAIYNSNCEDERAMITNNYELFYNKNDGCYHIVDRDVDISVKMDNCAIASAKVNSSIDIEAEGYKAMIKTFKSQGYIPESVVAQMASVTAKASSLGSAGAESFNKLCDTISSIQGGEIVNTGVEYEIPESALTLNQPVVDKSGLIDYSGWMTENLSEQLDMETLEKPDALKTDEINTSFQNDFSFDIKENEEGLSAPGLNENSLHSGTLKGLQESMPNVGVSLTATGQRAALTDLPQDAGSVADFESARTKTLGGQADHASGYPMPSMGELKGSLPKVSGSGMTKYRYDGVFGGVKTD